jgi:thioredoxin reductase (NADPH)
MTDRQGAGVGDPVVADAVVVGAGPVGLFQVFELGLLGIHAHVVDALPHVGGQPVELYPDKPIYDIPALPVCTGQQLTEALARQCAPFAPTFHLGQSVSGLERQSDGRWLVTTSRGNRLLAKTVIIAAGVGAFEPRRLKVDGLDRFEGTQLLHHRPSTQSLGGQDVLVVGDDDQAIGCALELAEREAHRPRSVTLVHRRDSFRAEPDRIARMRERCAQGSMRFVVGQVTGFRTETDRLQGVDLSLPDGGIETLPVDTLLVLQGLSPRLGPITGWGLSMERKLLVVDPQDCSTSETGIFAVGDINTYPGKKKLIVCGFHECVMAAYAAAALVFPGKQIPLEYTTSSTRLHRLLGA